jgi:glycerophosphoryl diester phosphodiesterase
MPGIDDRPILKHWRALVAADLVYKAIAFAILTPLIGLMLRLLIQRTGRTAVADADIALFFFTTRPGVLALLLIGALAIGVTALEQTCLMTIMLAAMRGYSTRVRDALATQRRARSRSCA